MGEGIYIAKRNGTCQHCGHLFFSSSPTPGPLCYHCKTSTVVQAKMVSDANASRADAMNGASSPLDDANASPASASITWAGHTVTAPNFTQDQFDRAMGRAFVDELEVKPDRQDGRYLVGHPDAYAVSREQCTCKAGQTGTPCKHRAVLIAHLDIRVPAIAKQWQQLHDARPVREAVHA